MTQNLKACVIQIQDSNGTIHGTGFIIDANTAVTCAHVIDAVGAAPGETVTITFALTGDTCPAEVLADAWRPPDEDDIAILRLQSALPNGVTPVILGPSEDTLGHHFRAFGYPKVGDIQGVWAEGKILGSITDSQGTTMLQLDSQQVAQGMSGGPVLDIDGDRVVGMITATYHPDETLKFRDAAFATPVEAINKLRISLALVPPLPSSSRRPMFGKPFQSPPLPAHFVPRPEVTDALKTRLLNDEITKPGVLVISAIHGLGGIGKSTLAAALAHDPEVQHRFKDGVLWVTLGQQPNLLSLVSSWVQALGDYDFHPTTIEAVTAHLRTLLQDKATLLVVDDVWEPKHALPFRVGGSRGQVLITTRRADVAEEVNAELHQMDVMTPNQSIDLLSARLDRQFMKTERDDALRLAKVVGYLPLALDLAAARIARGKNWRDLCEALEKEIARLEA